MLLVTVLVFASTVMSARAVSTPYGCEIKDGVFTCEYKKALPKLDAMKFDPRPQRLIIIDINGPITSAHFTNFGQINRTTFDPNYSSSLTLLCLSGGSAVLSLDNSSFEGLGYFQDVRIINCNLNSVPVGAFTNLGTLNYLSFEGGIIDNLDTNAFLGVNIIKDNTLPIPRGEFAMSNAKLVQGGLNVGVLDPLQDASVLTLNNCRIRIIDKDLFSKMKYLSRINLDNNPFNYIQENIFSGLESLRVVSMDNIPWTCTCTSLWFLQYASDQGIDIQGDMLCSRPLSYNRKRLTTYQREACGTAVVSRCPPQTVSFSGVCLTWLQITSFVVTFLSFIVLVVSAAFITKNRRDICKKGQPRIPVKSINGHRAAPKKVSPCAI